jgi:hypothetical protein
MSLVSMSSVEHKMAALNLSDEKETVTLLSVKNEVPLVATLLAKNVEAVNKEANIQNLLKTVDFVMRLQGDAIKCILQNDLEVFDGLVSDAQCQLRALLVVLIKKTLLVDDVLRLQIIIQKKRAELQHKIKSLSQKAVVKAAGVNECIREFELLVPQALVALAQAFFLAQTKILPDVPMQCLDCGEQVLGVREKTHYPALATFYKDKPIPVGAAKFLGDHAKVCLAETSCSLIMEQAKSSLDIGVRSMLCKANIKVIEGRNQLPCYYTLKAVVERCIASDIRVLLKVRKSQHTPERLDNPLLTSLFLRSTGKELVPTNPTAQEETLPLIVIDGQISGKVLENESVDEYVKRVMQVGFLKIAEMNGAHHSQCTKDGEIEQIPLMAHAIEHQEADLSPYILAEMKKLKLLKLEAEKLGACENVQTLYTIKHIFADTLISQGTKGVKLMKIDGEAL